MLRGGPSPKMLPSRTYLPSFSICADAAGSRPASVCEELKNEFHQPEAMIWSLSRSDDTRMPSVGMVQIMTKASTAAWTPKRPTKDFPVAAAISVSSGFFVRLADVVDHDRKDRDHDGDGGPHHCDGAPDLRDHDLPENLERAGAVDHGGFQRLFRDTAQRRRQDHH